MLYPDFRELVDLGGKPNRLALGSHRPTLAAAAGNTTSPFRGQGLTFQEVREYRPGDDIRTIDWRVTARVNKPHMKVFTEDRERTVMLCVDANAAMRFGTRGTFKSIQAARAAALLGRLANGSHDRVGSVLFGDVPDGIQYFKPARSRRGLWPALRVLSRQTTGDHAEEVPIEGALRFLDRVAPTGSLIFVISDFHRVSDALEQSLGTLRRRCDVVLVAVEDPADGVIAPTGLLKFSDDHGRTAVIDTDDRAGQRAYAEQWLSDRTRLDEIRARCGIGMIAVQTGNDIHDDLMPGLRRLARGRRT